MNEKTVEFSVAFMFPWLKGNVGVDSRMINVSTMNTILSIVPAGRDNQTIPLKNVSAVNISGRIDFKSMVIGVVLLILGMGCFTESFIAGIVWSIIAIGIIGSSIITTLTIQRSGSNFTLAAACYCRKNLVEIKEAIDQALIYDTDKTDMSKHVDEYATAIGNQFDKALNKDK